MSENGNEAGRPTNEEALAEANERLETRLDSWRDKHYDNGSEGNGKMNGFNRVVMVGRLTRDPEVKQTKSGRAVSDLALAVREPYKGQDGEPAERSCFVDIVVWGKLAETCGEYLKKGRVILVEGRLQLDRWQAADGQKRSKHRITANRIQFLTGDRKDTSVTAEEPAVAAPAETVTF